MPRAATTELGEPSTVACPDCGATFRRSLLPFRLDGLLLGYFPADVCSKGHEYFTEESGAAIQAAAKVRGAWGRRQKRAENQRASRGKSPRTRRT